MKRFAAALTVALATTLAAGFAPAATEQDDRQPMFGSARYAEGLVE